MGRPSKFAVRYNIAPITFQIYVVYGQKRVFIRYLIGPREFAQWANVRDFVGPFTTSGEAHTRIVPQQRANTVIGGSTDTVSGPTQLLLLDVVNITKLKYLLFHQCRPMYVLYYHLDIGEI